MIRSLLPALALSLLPSLVSASENTCRSAESANYARHDGYGTATGADSDIVIIRDNTGRVVVNHSIAYLRTQRPYYVHAVETGSGGQYSIRFSYWCLNLVVGRLKGGSVEVWRGATRQDIDSLI